MMQLPIRYRYFCDRCGRVSATVEAETLAAAVEQLQIGGWQVLDGRHTCPRCVRARQAVTG